MRVFKKLSDRVAPPAYGVIIAGAMTASLTLLPSTAHAAESLIEDRGLAACLNSILAGGRAPDYPISAGDLEQLPRSIQCNSGPAINSFAGFEGAFKTQSILIGRDTGSAFTETSSLSALSELPNLKTLNILGSQITNDALSGLSNATGITSLTLDGASELSDLSPIDGLTGMRTLTLTNLPLLTDLSPISAFVGVTVLDIGQNASLSDLRPIRDFTGMRRLTIQSTQVADLTPISGMTEMTQLAASNTQVNSLEPLRGYTKLTNLIIASAQLSSLNGLEDVGTLRFVNANFNQLTEGIEALSDKPNLSILQLRGTSIESLTALEASTNLAQFEAVGNRIASLKGLPHPQPGGTAYQVSFQNIEAAAQYVPVNATTFLVDASGQVTLRDGVSFPAGLGGTWTTAEQPTPDPDLPMLRFSINGQSRLQYEFNDESSDTRFSGTVVMPVVLSSITSAETTTGITHEPLDYQVTVTEGFPVTTYALGPEAPEWLAIDPQTGKITGTPSKPEELTVQIIASDSLGNAIIRDLKITIFDPAAPKPEAPSTEDSSSLKPRPEDDTAKPGVKPSESLSNTGQASNLGYIAAGIGALALGSSVLLIRRRSA